MTTKIDDPKLPTNQIISRSIRGRLFMGFGAMTGILVIAIIIVLVRITTAENFATQVISIDLPTHDTSYDLDVNISQSQYSLGNWLLTHEPQFKTENLNAWNNITRITGILDQFSKSWTRTEDVNSWDKIKGLLSQLKMAQNKLITANTIGNNPILTTEIIPLINKILDMLDGPVTATGERVGGLFDTQLIQLQKNTSAIISDMNTIRIIEYILLVTSLLLSIFVTFYTVSGIMKYINIFREHSAKVASGDLRQRINVKSHDEMGQLGNDLNTMTESLATITKQITEACQHMVTTIAEVKHAVDIQSSGATEQASSINEITSSVEEIEQSSNQTIEKAKNLGEVAERTRAKGQMGLEAVEQSVLGMKAVRDKVQTIAQTILELSNQTQQVGEITAVVNTLAQQSKMLALNASIEAAKAGEAGKGFAVVASEVKNLAEQSEQSTTQVQKILEDIRHATEKAVMATEEGTKGVDIGTGLVEQTGDIVRSLSDVIHETTIASQQIEAAIRQEGVGIEQITAGMNEINQVTASFVESVKQTTEAISNLAVMVKHLKEYTDVYKV